MPQESRSARSTLLGWLFLGSLGLYVGSFLLILLDEYVLQTFWLEQYCPWYSEGKNYLIDFYWPLSWLVIHTFGI